MPVRLVEPRTFPAGLIPSWLPQITTGQLRYRLRTLEEEQLVVLHPANWSPIRYNPVGSAQRKAFTLEHCITWDAVASPPWAAIRAALGRVNDNTFLGRPSCEILFATIDVLTTFDPLHPTLNSVRYRLDYAFRERPEAPSWYYEFGDDTGTWDLAYAHDSSPLYNSATLSSLFSQ